jgi:hypothetical protein
MDILDDPISFFHELGLLHDACVEWLSWGDGEFRLVTDNLHANFMNGQEPSLEFPGYHIRPATVVFAGVKDVAGHERDGPKFISELSIQRLRDCYHVSIVGRGTWMFAFHCTVVGLEPAGKPASVDAHYMQLKEA